MEQNNLIHKRIYNDFIKKYPHLKEGSKELLKNFDLWKKNPCDAEDSFYNTETKLPVIFKKFNIDKNKELNYLEHQVGTTKNKFSISELTYENVQDVVKYAELFYELDYRVIICTYYGGYTYNNCTFSIENFDKKKLFIDNFEENLLYMSYDKNNNYEENIKSIISYNEDTTGNLCVVLN